MSELPTPLAERDRIPALDTLRGVAVLGIFLMNLRNFALPIREFDNPAFPEGPARAVDLWAWAVGNTFFEDKMIAIFSMLFGAGIILMTGRAAGRRAAVLHYRRMFWLFLIGLAHAYGLWYGDILNTYAVCGAALYPFRRLRPALLIAMGVVVFLVAVWIRVAPPISRTLDPAPAAARAAPPAPSRGDQILEESIKGEFNAYHGSWLDLARWRARLNTFWHFYGVVNFNFWRCAGFMLIGMGLYQLGVLSAARPSSVYWALLIGGYALGLTLFLLGFWPQLARTLGRAPLLNPEARPMLGLLAWSARYTAAAPIAVGHIAIVMLLCRSHRVARFLTPLAAAGRMALSNYLLQTAIAVLIFDGWALGQWGTWRMAELAGLALAVWAVQLALSPLWLRFFQFGPLEWLWRSLTYARIHPLLRRPAAS